MADEKPPEAGENTAAPKPPGGETPGGNSPPGPTDERTELKAAAAEIRQKLKEGELRGASEDTIHALIEELRTLNARLAELPKGEVQPKGAAVKKWIPW